ncbi:hypothetical protein JNM87_00360 [Candidatus Saccharibacteria bacterium]|nr:hypothetical protein [Candidatus Saccharibacteria bacterium]
MNTLLVRRVKLFALALGLSGLGLLVSAPPAAAIAGPQIRFSYPSVLQGVAYSIACLSGEDNPRTPFYVRLRRIGSNGSVTYGGSANLYTASSSTRCASLSVSGMKLGDKIQGYDSITGYYYTLRKI